MFDSYVYYEAEKESCDKQHFALITKQEYVNAIKRNPKIRKRIDGVCVGGAVMNGDKFHIAVLPKAKGLVGKQIIQAIDWGFSIANPFLAVVSTHNNEVKNLMKRYKHRLVKTNNETLTFQIFKGN